MSQVHPTYRGDVRATPVIIETRSNTTSYNLQDVAQFKHPYKIVGLSHRPFHASRKTETNKPLVADNVLKSAHLKLKRKATDEFINIPIENIVTDLTGYQAIYWINPSVYDFQNSLIVLADSTVINAGDCFELVVYTTDGQPC